MPHRLYRADTLKQKRTNYFVMEVFHGNTFLGKKVMKKGTPQKPNAKKVNKVKSDIGLTHGYLMSSTGAKFTDVFEDEHGFLFYWKHFDDIGMVKTLLN